MQKNTKSYILSILCLIAAFALVINCGPRSFTRNTSSSESLGPGTFDRSIKFGGLTRTYRIHIHPSFNKSKPIPLVLVFHGHFGTGRTMERMTHFDDVSDQNGLVVVYPDGIGRSWNAGAQNGKAERDNVDDVGFVSNLIDELARELPIDRLRVYATGISLGGIFTQRLGCELSNKIAAIAPVAGNLASSVAKNCYPTRPISVLMIHGTDDRLTPWEGGKTGGGGQIISVPATIQLWIERNKCPILPTITPLAKDVISETYAPCQGGTEVALYRIERGGHTWPGGTQDLPPAVVGPTNNSLNASEAIWDFFAKHSMTASNRARIKGSFATLLCGRFTSQVSLSVFANGHEA
jgi:polyhydroxybutyrate depolymerase